MPPSVSNLDDPDFNEPEVVAPQESTATTTVAGETGEATPEGETTTTAAGESTDATAPGAETTTTVEG